MRPLPVLVLLVAASGAASATVDVRLDPFGEPLLPFSGVRAVGGNVTAPCLRTPDGTAAPVALAVTGPAYASAVVVPSAVHAEACDGAFTAAFRVMVDFTAEAPALVPVPLRVTATVENATAHEEADATLLAVPAFFSSLHVGVDPTAQETTPQTVVTFPIAVRNEGNGRTKVFFEVTEKGENVMVHPPLPVVVGARGEPDSTVVVPFAVMSPWKNGYVDEQDAITLRTASHLALDPLQKGDATSVSMVLRTRGFYVPEAAGVAAAAALAVAALAWRRR